MANRLAVSHAVPLIPRLKFHSPAGQNTMRLIATVSQARVIGDHCRGSTLRSSSTATAAMTTT